VENCDIQVPYMEEGVVGYNIYERRAMTRGTTDSIVTP
jgi:hypothetical protein